ncbi:MAG: PAS domain S-box protein, partial [Proteobacteria bacterium]|nr:PAS domain S-box protein [Pseudomonadota bacterium]
TLNDGRCIDINESMIRMTGYSREESIGRTTVEIGWWPTAKDRDRVTKMIRETMSVQDLEIRFRNKAGQIRLGSISATIIHMDGVACLISAIQDVTELREAENAFKESQELLASLFNSALECIFILDFKGGFIEANPAALDLLGCERDQIKALNFIELLGNEQGRKAIRAFKALRDGFPHDQTMEYELKRKDGASVIVEARAFALTRAERPYAIGMLVRDITAPRRAELALLESEIKYRNVVEHSSDGIWIVQDALVKFANRQLTDLLGYERREIIDTPFLTFTDLAELPKVKDRIKRFMSGEQDRQKYDTVLTGRHGHRLQVELNVSPTIFENRRAAIILTRDITERKRAEEKLRKGEEIFHKTFQTIPMAVSITDFESGRFVEVNTAFERITGYTRSEALGRGPSDLNLFSDIDESMEFAFMLEKHGSAREFEARFQTRAGEVRQGSWTLQLIELNGNPCIISMMSDITERKEAEEEIRRFHQELEDRVERRTAELAAVNERLKSEIVERGRAEAALNRSEIYFRAMTENAIDMIAILDGDATIVYRSPSFERILGYKQDAFIGQSVFDLIFDDDLDRARKIFRETMDHPGRVGTLVFRARHRDSNWRTLESFLSRLPEESGVQGVIVNSRDVTDRLRTEEALRKSEEKYRRIIETANEGVLILDKDDRCSFTNPKVAEMTGYTMDELMGRHIFSPMDKKDRPEVEAMLERRRKGLSENSEVRVRRKDGTELWVLASASPLYDSDGQYAGSLSLITDITERKRTEEELRVMKWAAESSINGIAMGDYRGRVTYVNEACLKMWGYTYKHEVLGVPSRLFWASEKDARNAFQTVWRNGIWFGEMKARRKDGTVFHGQLSATLVRNEAGEPICTLGSFVDISERVEAETDLRKKERELAIQARKLEDSNTALKVLLEHRDLEKISQEKRLVTTLERLIFPYLEKLRAECTKSRQKKFLDVIASNLSHIASPFSRRLSDMEVQLTPSEIEVANLLRHGKTSKEISSLLGISLATVSVHRKNIRKKFGLTHKKNNLKVFLKSIQ